MALISTGISRGTFGSTLQRYSGMSLTTKAMKYGWFSAGDTDSMIQSVSVGERALVTSTAENKMTPPPVEPTTKLASSSARRGLQIL
jgi:hypothetical protein